MIATGIITTIVVGAVGGVLGSAADIPALGVIASIAVMGGFLMAEIRKISKD